AAAANPAKAGIEDDEPDHAGPEDRHRVTEKAEHADDVIGQFVPVDGGDDAERYAKAGADHDGKCRKLNGGRHNMENVADHRLAGADRYAEITGHHITEITEELLPDRTVEPEALIDHAIGVLGGVLADDGAHRIGRHHPADDEG